MKGQANSQALSVAMMAAALVLVLVGLQHWGDFGQSVGRQVQDRLTELEKGQRRALREQGDLDTRTTNLEAGQAAIEERVDAQVPQSARWIPLEAGGNEQWELPVGGRAQVQFLSISDEGLPVFRIYNRGMEGDLALRPGVAVQAVDDLGDKQRTFVTILHRLALDPNGQPTAALVSQGVREE